MAGADPGSAAVRNAVNAPMSNSPFPELAQPAPDLQLEQFDFARPREIRRLEREGARVERLLRLFTARPWEEVLRDGNFARVDRPLDQIAGDPPLDWNLPERGSLLMLLFALLWAFWKAPSESLKVKWGLWIFGVAGILHLTWLTGRIIAFVIAQYQWRLLLKVHRLQAAHEALVHPPDPLPAGRKGRR